MAILQDQWDFSGVLYNQPPEASKSPTEPLRASSAHSPLAQGLRLSEEGPGLTLGVGKESTGVRELHPHLLIASVWLSDVRAPLEAFTVIHIHDLLAHILSLLRINMKPFFRVKFHGFIFPRLSHKVKTGH